MIIKRIAPLSFAKLTGMLYAVLGFVFGAVCSLIALAGWLAPSTAGSGGIGAIVGVAAVLLFPVLYGVMGFVTTFVGAWLYNIAADLVGGVEVDVQ